jgi:hypothetical protein
VSGRRPFVIACAASRREERPSQAKLPSRLKCAWPGGCFHREHSPHAYQIIDAKLTATDDSFAFEEHESGPEILVYLAVTTAGLSLAKSIVDLITAIIKARSEGINKGDHPSELLELIVRRVHNAQEFREETVLRIGHEDAVDEAKVERQLEDALRKLLKDQPPTRSPRKKR